MTIAELQQLAIDKAGDLGWRSAMYILLSPAFEGEGRVRRHVGPYGIDFETMIDEGGFSGGEARLLRVAWSLFNGGGDVSLNAVFATLGPKWAKIALEAMALFAGRPLSHYARPVPRAVIVPTPAPRR
jgi:hypothetical protein